MDVEGSRSGRSWRRGGRSGERRRAESNKRKEERATTLRLRMWKGWKELQAMLDFTPFRTCRRDDTKDGTVMEMDLKARVESWHLHVLPSHQRN